MITRIVLGTLAVTLLSACGGTDADVVDSKKSEAATSGASTSGDAAQKARLLESGFGQADQYAWVMALVKNESDHAGQTVTVNFNVKDADGRLLASGSQVASFNWVGQTLPVSTQVDLGRGTTADSVEATVLVEDDGTFDDQVVESDWGTFDGEIYKQYGTWGAKFQIQNPTSEPLSSPAVEVICRNASGDIMGGSSDYPDLIPPSGTVLVDVSDLYTEKEPDSCLAYLHPWL